MPARVVLSPIEREARAMTEAALFKLIRAYAKDHGWKVVHIVPARSHGRMVTPYQGDAGMPDVVLARGGKVILAELKQQTAHLGGARVTEAQQEWIDASGGYLWRPMDWLDGTIHDVLD